MEERGRTEVKTDRAREPMEYLGKHCLAVGWEIKTRIKLNNGTQVFWYRLPVIVSWFNFLGFTILF
jgi:hypothetical protein